MNSYIIVYEKDEPKYFRSYLNFFILRKWKPVGTIGKCELGRYQIFKKGAYSYAFDD